MKKYILYFLFFSSFANAQQTEVAKQQYGIIYYNSPYDSLAEFQKGHQELMQYIVDNFRVHGSIMNDYLQKIFSVIAELNLDTTGSINKVIIDNSAGRMTEPLPVEIEKEIIRVFNTMPNWKPAYKNGIKVPAQVYIPVRFIIVNDGIEIYNLGYEATKGQSKKTKALRLTLGFIGVSIIASWVFLIIGRASREK